MDLRPERQLDRLAPDLHRVLDDVCRRLAAAGGRAWLVGGTVRDLALGRDTGDLDLEVFGLPADRLQDTLAAAYDLDLVGRAFGILKLRGWPVDVGLPRREAKLGRGHKGFAIDSDPHLDLPTAAARRDFTLNAVYLDPLTGEVADPWQGLDDLDRGLLRHTSPAFGEDPLRVLRGMQLVARFELHAVPETVALCRAVAREGLPGERLWGEWVKLLTLGRRPSLGLEFLRETGWLAHFPELDALRGCPQDPHHHPEGDVWIHTLHALDAFAAERTGDPWEDLVVGCAVLCHDLGKPGHTTREPDGRVRSLGHEQVSVARTESLLGAMTDNRRLLAEVKPLVAEHGHPTQLFRAGASAAAVRRLAARVGRIDRLVRVARADNFGRPPLPADAYPAGDWLLAVAAAHDVIDTAPAPLIQGRHLVALGETPGPRFTPILDEVYAAQLDGDVTDETAALALLKRILARSDDPEGKGRRKD
ncbi:polynucleotide adenylyltransferase [bacterium]|nr:polynucleotide adenylyltransferase [bacterium]